MQKMLPELSPGMRVAKPSGMSLVKVANASGQLNQIGEEKCIQPFPVLCAELKKPFGIE